jgi:hypothetical protein
VVLFLPHSGVFRLLQLLFGPGYGVSFRVFADLLGGGSGPVVSSTLLLCFR